MSAPPSPVKPYSGLTVDTRTTITPFSLALEDTQHSTDDDDDSLSSNEGIEVLGADPSPKNVVSWAHLWSGKIVRSRLFKRGVLFNILLVSIIMGIATVDFVRERPGLALLLEGIVRFFRFVFTVEIFLDILHYQRQAFQMGWVVFDIVILGMSWWVSLSILVVRSFRLIRALRKASGVSDLKHIVKALLRVIPKIVAILFLLTLIMYIFTVIFTDLYQDMYDKGLLTENYFGRLDRTAFTLFRIMTLDNWTEIAEEVMVVYPWSCILFIALIVTTSFFFGALVIAVVADAFTAIGRERMIRALEDPKAMTLQSSRSHDVARLEEKVQQLSSTIYTLVEMQRRTQESLDRLAKEKADEQMSETKSLYSS
eukprot:scaffold22432_cov168-Amphora_coffeaeformis.AAC.8